MTAISVVVPVHSGEEYLTRLVAALQDLRNEWSTRHPAVQLAEVILVDDAAADRSPAIMERLAEEHRWVQVITLSRNYGQHPATICGILHATGDWIVTMDEDLQHDPMYIERMLRTAVTEHSDVVYASPEGSVHGKWRRDMSSRLYKWILARLARNPVVRDFSSFRLCRGSVARAGASVAGHETYLDVALTWFTDRFLFERVPMVDERFRDSGTSGYGFSRLLAHARRLVVSSHTRLMRIGAYLGLVAVALAGFFGVRAVALRWFSDSTGAVPGWASLFVGILFFGGLTAFLLVVILEYLINVALHTQGKPTFFVVDRSSDRMVAESLGVPHGGHTAP